MRDNDIEALLAADLGGVSKLLSVDLHCDGDYNLHLTDQAVRNLILSCPNLQSLNVSRCRSLTDDSIVAVAACPNLRSLNVRMCRIVADDSIIAVAACPNLQSLDVSGCTSLTDKSIIAVARCPNLQSLDVSECTSLTDKSIIALAGCPNLQSLNVFWCYLLTDESIIAVASRRKLQALNVSRCRKLTDDSIAAVAACPNLQSLDVSACRKLTDDSIAAVAACPNLQSLNVSEWTSLTDDSIVALAACPNLQSLDLSGCWELTDLRPLQALLPPKGKLCYLFVDSNPRLRLPEEISLSRNASQILAYILREGKRPWLHIKGVLLGEPESGKSWIRDRLMGRKPLGRVQTHDFEVETLKLTGVRGEKKPVRVRLFDFGGQALLHGSHRLFLASERNLFIVPLNVTLPLNPAVADDTARTNRLDYWLRMIRWTFRQDTRIERGGGRGGTGTVPAPVLVVVSWCDRKKWAGWKLDEQELQDQYGLPNLRVLQNFSADKPARTRQRTRDVKESPDDIERLKAVLREMVGGMGYVFTAGYPKDFRDLRKWLGSRDAGIPTFTGLHNFRAICRQVGCSEPKWQKQYLLMLNNLGLVLWRGTEQEVRRDRSHPLYRHVFNPGWVRGPMYAMINDAFPTQQPWLARDEVYPFLAGHRRRSTCRPWRRYKFRPEDADLVMGLMTSCELAVELDEAEQAGGGYLVLDKLRVSQFVALDPKDFNLFQTLSCEFLGEGVIPRFIGRMHKQIAAEDRETYVFRNKVRVFLPAHAAVKAAVHGDMAGSRIFVGIGGGTTAEQHELLGQIKGELGRYVSFKEGDAPPSQNRGGAPLKDKTADETRRRQKIYKAWVALGRAANKAETLTGRFDLSPDDIRAIYERERKRRERRGEE